MDESKKLTGSESKMDKSKKLTGSESKMDESKKLTGSESNTAKSKNTGDAKLNLLNYIREMENKLHPDLIDFKIHHTINSDEEELKMYLWRLKNKYHEHKYAETCRDLIATGIMACYFIDKKLKRDCVE